MAWTRFQAVVVYSVQAQVAAIFGFCGVLLGGGGWRRAGCVLGRVFGSGFARSPSRASSLSQASRIQAIKEASSQALFSRSHVTEMSQAGVLAGADDILDAGVDAVRGASMCTGRAALCR